MQGPLIGGEDMYPRPSSGPLQSHGSTTHAEMHDLPPAPAAPPQQQSARTPSPPATQYQMFQVFDRRINFSLLPTDVSVYSMLRAWVQDDPTRAHPSFNPLPTRPSPVALPSPDPETALTLLRLQPKRKLANPDDEVVDTLKTTRSERLLDLHVGYMKQVRKMWQKGRARRYQRYKTRLAMLGIPPVTQLERVLAGEQGGVPLLHHPVAGGEAVGLHRGVDGWGGVPMASTNAVRL